MNCPKCHSPLLPNAKFCTHCGQKIADGPRCPHCGAAVRESSKFCPSCGQPMNSSRTEPASKDGIAQMTQAGDRIYWDIQPGQVARVITEAELESYRKFKGIVIAEGTTAYLRANGKTIATITGGVYDFDTVSGKGPFLERVLRVIGKTIVYGLQALCSIVDIIFKSNSDTTPEEERRKQQDMILECFRRGDSISVVILLNKAFPLCFGGKQNEPDDYTNFVPMRVQTRHVEAEVGVNAYFRISEPQTFIQHYLLDTNQLNTTLIVHEITDTVRAAVESVLRDVEIDGHPLPPTVSDALKQKLHETAEQDLFGLSVVRIVEISVNNDELKELSAMASELYLSEKGFDQICRQHEFVNRLADEENAQALHEARTEADFNKAIEQINHDNLLTADEAERFRVVLFNERIVHDAQSAEERDKALFEIQRQGLLRKSDIQQLSQQQGHVINMMRLNEQIEFETRRLEGNDALALQNVKNELERQGLQDDYAENRLKRMLDINYEEERRQRDLDYEDERRRRALDREEDEQQFRQFMAAQQAEEQSRENQRRHEAEMERTKWEHAAGMTQEQILATGGGEAAVELARAQQNKYNVEAERQANERVESLHRENDAFMRQMMNDLVQMNGAVRASEAEHREERLRDRIAVQDEQLRANDERILRQEGRMDTAYDRALNYTTREATRPIRNQAGTAREAVLAERPQAAPALQKTCPNCGSAIAEGEKFCPECGTKTE